MGFETRGIGIERVEVRGSRRNDLTVRCREGFYVAELENTGVQVRTVSQPGLDNSVGRRF